MGRGGMRTYIQVLLVGDLYTSGWLMTKRICHPTSQHHAVQGSTSLHQRTAPPPSQSTPVPTQISHHVHEHTTHILGSPQRNPRDTRHMLQTQLGNRLPRLLLVARMHGDGRAG